MLYIDPNSSNQNLIRTRNDEAIDPRTGERFRLERKPDGEMHPFLFAVLVFIFLLILL